MSVEKTENGITIEIPSRCRFFDAFFLFLWCIVWIPFGGLIPFGIFGRSVPLIVPIILSISFIFIGFAGFYKFLYWLFGKEIIEIKSDIILYSMKVFGLGKTKKYKASDISKIRVSPKTEFIDDRNYALALEIIKGGAFTIYVKRKAIRFGRNINYDQAINIIDDIKKVLNFY